MHRPSKRLLVSLLIWGFCATLGFGKLLDPQSPANPVLDGLVDKVDSQGIDISRSALGNTPPPADRPVVTPLQGFTSDAEAKAARALWMKDFQGNIQSILVGVKDPSRSPTTTKPGGR